MFREQFLEGLFTHHFQVGQHPAQLAAGPFLLRERCL